MSTFQRQTARRPELCQRARAIAGTGSVSDHDLSDIFLALGVPTKYVEAQVRFYRSQGYSPTGPVLRQSPARPKVASATSGMSPIGHPCHYCGAPAEHIEHVWPRSRGGDDHPNNLVRACQPCNSRKGTRSLLTMACPTCGHHRDPGDVETSTGTAFYSCRCGDAWRHVWDLQAVKLVA